MKERQVHRDDFKVLQNKGETSKWAREKSKSGEKKTRKDMVYVSWICIVVCILCFYQNFKPLFTEKALPLTNLTEKGNTNKLVMELEHQRAFERLKGCMVSLSILKLSGLNTGFTLWTDASNVGIGAVLMQETDEIKFPIGYASKKVLPGETSFSVIQRECLAFIWGIKKFHMYLYQKEFQVETIHCPLIYMLNTKLTNSTVMRWVLSLQTYRLRIAAIKDFKTLGQTTWAELKNEFIHFF